MSDSPATQKLGPRFAAPSTGKATLKQLFKSGRDPRKDQLLQEEPKIYIYYIYIYIYPPTPCLQGEGAGGSVSFSDGA